MPNAMSNAMPKTIVIKYGGSTLAASDEIDATVRDIIALRESGYTPVIVHGGGKAITHLLHQLGQEAVFRDGLRVTDATTLAAAEMVLCGSVNKQLVAAFGAQGCPAVGISGVDGGLLHVKRKSHPAGDIGFVGEVVAVRPAVIEALVQAGFLPVIAPIGSDATGQRYNVNADSAAGAIAGALGAETLVMLTDVPGLLQDTPTGRDVLPAVTPAEIAALLADGTIAGGMVPKVEACLTALEAGAQQVQIVDRLLVASGTWVKKS